MAKMPNRHFPGIKNGIVDKHYSILAQLMTATDDGNAETRRLFGRNLVHGFEKTAMPFKGRIDKRI